MEKEKRSLVKWLLIVNFISILGVGVYLALNSGLFMLLRTNADYREIASATSVNVANVFDSLSDGKFSYDEKNNVFKKGNVVIDDKAFWKSQEFNKNIHHTIFWDKTRIYTDIKDEKGNVVTGTKLTDENIINTVEKEGIFTDNNVLIYGTRYSVCYYPLRNDDEIVGYVFTGVNQEESMGYILRDSLIIALISIGLSIFIIFIVQKKVKEKSVGFDEKLTKISVTANEKRESVSKMGVGTKHNMLQISEAIKKMSKEVVNQASKTEKIVKAMENFGNNIDDIISHVSNTSNITGDSIQLIEELKSELNELERVSKANSQEIENINKQILEDNEAVENIQDIVSVINEIAFQITILSFNASVEAARAGEAGRGFAVVSESIKELSDKTQNSVNDISRIIVDINEKMSLTQKASQELVTKNEKTTQALVATKERMSCVTDSFDTIAKNVGAIKNESSDILVSKNQVVDTVTLLAKASEDNAAMSEEITSTSNIVIGQTEKLLKEINQLDVISDIITDVKKDFR